MIKFKNFLLAIKCQGFREFFITRNGWGIFSKNSHINRKTGKEKVKYSEESAKKAAISLSKKTGNKLSAYKCMYCDGWHIGNDR